MSSTAYRYLQRKPRYVFRREDDTLIRFANMNTKGVTFEARLRDLSETGVSFNLPPSQKQIALNEGDMLKLEFTIPGRKRIACFATIVRVERKALWNPDWGSQEYSTVGLHFQHLPTLHRRALELGLKPYLKIADDESVSRFLDFQADEQKQIAALCGFALALLGALFFIVLSSTAWIKPFTNLF